jgi:glutathione S-transferase
MSDITLFVDSAFVSPWAMSAFVAFEEKGVPYTLQSVSLAAKETFAPAYGARTQRVPALRRGGFWLGESTAIAEWLAETFPFPGHPRLFPEDLNQRGTCRELQAWLRTDLMALRKERPTSTLWGARATTPLSAEAQADARRLITVSSALLAHGGQTLFERWCIADLDLTIALQRLHLNEEALPEPLIAYAIANWKRPSSAKWNAQPRG